VQDAEFARQFDVRYVSLDEAFSKADIIALHLAGSPKVPIIGAAELGRMRPGAVLVNAARGGWVEETALGEALKSGRLGGAYLDVFCNEPYTGPLTELPNTVLTAHIGSYAVECRVGMEVEAAQKVADFFRSGKPA
jgi:D-3-phosphoglycerate dehydrogenase